MAMPTLEKLPWGHRWRSSTTFTLVAIVMALFTDVFLYGFIVPVLPYMIEERLNVDKSKTQSITLFLLSESALVGFFASIIVGHIADRISNKRTLLLYSLGAAMVGSLGLAIARSAAVLFISRFIQAFASNAIFVIGLATMAETIPSDRMGQAMGLVTMAASVGTSTGTMLAGVLLELIGYWLTWCTAFALLGIDAVLRLLMIERKRGELANISILLKGNEDHNAELNVNTGLTFPSPAQSEAASLLSQESLEENCYSYGTATQTHTTILPNEPSSSPSEEKEKSGLSFYIFVLQQRRFLGGIASFISYSMIIASFDTTLPLHVRDAFNWGSLQAGLLFLALQGPGILLGPLAGNLKDKVGTRSPAAVAFFVIGPVLMIMGVPGDGRWKWQGWFDEGCRGEVVYTVGMIVVGCMIPLLSGVGVLEMTAAIEEIQIECPQIFGPRGGNSRAISIANMSWIIGIFIGPIISGVLIDKVGYFQTNCILAALCILSGLNALFSLGPKGRVRNEREDTGETGNGRCSGRSA